MTDNIFVPIFEKDGSKFFVRTSRLTTLGNLEVAIIEGPLFDEKGD